MFLISFILVCLDLVMPSVTVFERYEGAVMGSGGIMIHPKSLFQISDSRLHCLSDPVFKQTMV